MRDYEVMFILDPTLVVPFKASTELPKELDRRLKISDAVMRHIIVCQDEN